MAQSGTDIGARHLGIGVLALMMLLVCIQDARATTTAPIPQSGAHVYHADAVHGFSAWKSAEVIVPLEVRREIRAMGPAVRSQDASGNAESIFGDLAVQTRARASAPGRPLYQMHASYRN